MQIYAIKIKYHNVNNIIKNNKNNLDKLGSINLNLSKNL